MRSIGLSEQEFSIVFGVTSLSLILGSLVSARLSKAHVSSRRILWACLLLMAVGAVGALVMAWTGQVHSRSCLLWPSWSSGAALGDVQHGPDVLDTGAPTRGAQKFPRAASCRISLSRVRSATALRRRWFSVSSSFMCLT